MTDDFNPEDWQVILNRVYQTEPKSWKPVAEMLLKSADRDENFPLTLVESSVVIPRDRLVNELSEVLRLLLDYRCNYDF